jgi:hypothetical protein
MPAPATRGWWCFRTTSLPRPARTTA